MWITKSFRFIKIKKKVSLERDALMCKTQFFSPYLDNKLIQVSLKEMWVNEIVCFLAHKSHMGWEPISNLPVVLSLIKANNNKAWHVYGTTHSLNKDSNFHEINSIHCFKQKLTENERGADVVVEKGGTSQFLEMFSQQISTGLCTHNEAQQQLSVAVDWLTSI